LTRYFICCDFRETSAEIPTCTQRVWTGNLSSACWWKTFFPEILAFKKSILFYSLYLRIAVNVSSGLTFTDCWKPVAVFLSFSFFYVVLGKKEKLTFLKNIVILYLCLLKFHGTGKKIISLIRELSGINNLGMGRCILWNRTGTVFFSVKSSIWNIFICYYFKSCYFTIMLKFNIYCRCLYSSLRWAIDVHMGIELYLQM